MSKAFDTFLTWLVVICLSLIVVIEVCRAEDPCDAANPDYDCSICQNAHPNCVPKEELPPLAKPDGQGGFIIAPPECQSAGNPVNNPNPLPHCLSWSDPNPPTFGGCDYANTPFDALSVDCQEKAMTHQPRPSAFIPWETYFRVRRGYEPAFDHWLSCGKFAEFLAGL